MTRANLTFSITTLTPAILLGAGAVFGGLWIAAAILWLTALVTVLDRFIPGETAPGRGNGTILAILIMLAHLALIPLTMAGVVRDALDPLEKAGLFFGSGLWLGQVSNATAHELIHRGERLLHRLGMWAYITLLFGHHTSAHVLVHHVHVATAGDPNSARKGEGLYRYMLRAWIGSFAAGYSAEAARLARINRPRWQHPYVVYVGGALLCLVAAGLLAGPLGLFAYLALGLHAQMQLLMSDYVQHYGLARGQNACGKPEPVGPRHSWNSPHWASSALMLNATRHSDHHMHPRQSYPALAFQKDMPMLPRPLPLMASIALVPPLWRQIMDPHVDRWRDA